MPLLLCQAIPAPSGAHVGSAKFGSGLVMLHACCGSAGGVCVLMSPETAKKLIRVFSP